MKVALCEVKMTIAQQIVRKWFGEEFSQVTHQGLIHAIDEAIAEAANEAAREIREKCLKRVKNWAEDQNFERLVLLESDIKSISVSHPSRPLQPPGQFLLEDGKVTAEVCRCGRVLRWLRVSGNRVRPECAPCGMGPKRCDCNLVGTLN